MRPISLSPEVNHNAPSGPVIIEPRSPLGNGNSVNTPVVVKRSTYLPYSDVNQIAPSGPLANPPMPSRVTGNSVMTPVVVMRAILFPKFSTNQSAPSDPLTICVGELFAVGI